MIPQESDDGPDDHHAVSAESILVEETRGLEGISYSKRVRKPSNAFKDYQDSGNLDPRAFRAKVGNSSKKKSRKSEDGNAEEENVDGAKEDGEDPSKIKSKASTKSKQNGNKDKTPITPGSDTIGSKNSLQPVMKPKIVIDPKEKLLDETEEGMISRALRRRPAHVQQKKSLPEGPASLDDMNAAMRQSFLDISTPLCDWSIPEAKYIGCICKVYWDGEGEWFYARILNYDPHHKKHYIFYFEDSTAEWISIENEAVMIASDMKLVQWKSFGVWPALVYWISQKAEPLISGKNEICVEFFNEKNQLERYFASPHHLNPLSVEFLPERRSKKYEKCWEAAKSEKEAIDTVVDEVVRSIRSAAPKLLKGKEWLGLRVRTPTHRVLTKAERRNQGQQGSVESAYCTGTVKTFCPLINEYFVVFDEDQLQPQWVDFKGKVELLLGPTGLQHSSETRKQDSEVGISINVHSNCLLCEVSCEDNDHLQCIQCQILCHSYCIPPPNGLRPVNEVATKKSGWKCWNCCVCHSCGVNQWNSQLIHWNARRIDPTGPEKIILLCGVCLNRYKHHKEFCTICYKLYSDSPILSQINEPEATESNVIQDESQVDEQWMIQCNECDRWVHAKCEGIDQIQYKAISEGTHPIWGDEYLCPICRVKLSSEIIRDLKSYDKTFMFAEPVTTSVAANYFDIIRNPMDLFTMRGKSEKGLYKSLQAVRQDVELMCCNAFMFNRVGDDFWIAARSFYLQALELFDRNTHTTFSSAYGKEAEGWLEKWTPPQLSNSKKRKSIGSSVAIESKATNENTKAEKAQKLDDGSKKGIVGATNLASMANWEVKEGKKKKVENSTKDQVEANSLEVMHVTPTTNSDDSLIPGSNTIAQDNMACEEDDDAGPQFISIQRVPNPDPPTFVTPFTSLLTAEEAVFAFCQDQCFACGSTGSKSNFLFCIDCGEAYHTFCAMTPVTMTLQAKSHWRCVNCKICEVCGLVGEKDSETLVFCESCDQAFHIYCLSPALSTTPEFHLYCSSCVRCQYCEDNVGEDDISRSRKLLGDSSFPSTDVHGNVLKSWSPSQMCCYLCDVDNKHHTSMMVISPIHESSSNFGNSTTSKKKGVNTAVQAAEVEEGAMTNPSLLTCFDCGNKFNKEAVIAAAVSAVVTNQPVSGRRSSSSNTPNSVPHIDIDPYFWTCDRCDRKKSHEWGCHLGDTREAQSLLKKISSIQEKRFKQINALKALALKSITEPLNIFRKCNGLYYLMMVLWGSLRTSSIANNNLVMVAPTTCATANKTYIIAKLMKGTLDQLSPSTQWITARSRRYMNYSRRRIHRHPSHPLHAGGDNRPVHLPTILNFNSEAMARLAQMASTFLFTTENEQYSEEYQIRELVLVLIQVSFLLFHDGNGNTVAPSAPAQPINATSSPATSAGTPQLGTATDLREDLAKNVHGSLKSIYSKFGFGSNTLILMDIMEARRICRNSTKASPPGSSGENDQKKKIEYVISHNFSSNEIIDMVATIMTTLASCLREFPYENIEQICKFVEKSFSKIPIGSNRPAPTKRPVDLLNYFKSCKNPLISPGFIIPVDLYPSGQPSTKALNSPSERVDVLINSSTMLTSHIPQHSRSENDSDLQLQVDIQPWRASGLNQGNLLTSSRHSTISFNVPTEINSVPNAEQHISTVTESQASKSEYSNKYTDILNQVREEVLGIIREEYESEQSFDKIDSRQIIEDMLNKYLESDDTPIAPGELEVRSSNIEQRTEVEVIEDNVEEKDSSDTTVKAEAGVLNTLIGASVAMIGSTTTTPSTTCTALLLPPTPSTEDIAFPMVKPVHGWTATTNPDHEWIDPRTCVFCGEDENDDNYLLGRLLPFSDGAFVHVNCILWCQEVEEKNNILLDAYNARDRVIHQHCYLCRKRGASLNCCQTVKKCRRAFHLKCALACNSLLLMRAQIADAAVSSSGTVVGNSADAEKVTSGPIKSRFIMTCPAHVDCVQKIRTVTKGRPSNNRYNHGDKQLVPWEPGSIDRCLIIERQEPSVELQTLSNVLAQRRVDKAAKSGAVTILNLGQLSTLDAALYSTPSYIYPHGFRSSRIYWSMSQPNVRTVYLFEILTFADTEDWDLQQIEYLQDMLELMEQDDIKHKEFEKERADQMVVEGEESNTEPDNKLGGFFYSKPEPRAMLKKDSVGMLSIGVGLNGNVGPLFRCVPLDNTTTPLFARHLYQLYNYIMQAVETCNANVRRHTSSKAANEITTVGAYCHKRRSSWHGYGLTPYQFFGLGLPFTRYALEHIPESIASMMITDNQSRYSPVFKLPTDGEISAIQQLINSLKGNHHLNNRFLACGQGWNPSTGLMMDMMAVSNGSTRADPYIAKYNGVSGTRLTRILTKVVDSMEGGEGEEKGKQEEEEDEYAADLEKEGNRAEIEARIQKFLDMSRAYMINPYAKLEVRKSPIHGWGLFAKMNFERDDVIVEYMGEKIRQVVADRREAMYEQNGVGSCYLFRLDKDEIIDATTTGAMARFMNHCCEPNAYARIISFFKNDIEEKHIVIMAARDIQEGEEITYDYKFPIEEKKLKCYCGAPKCSGSMN